MYMWILNPKTPVLVHPRDSGHGVVDDGEVRPGKEPEPSAVGIRWVEP